MVTSDNSNAASNEVYVALLVPDAPSFPAIIDDERWNTFAVPRFRRATAEAVASWLNAMHEEDPRTWPGGAAFGPDGVLTVLEGEERATMRVLPDAEGRYAIGFQGWAWVLSTPAINTHRNAELLDDRARLTAESREILVTINIDGTDPVFPALPSAEHGWSRAGCPRFRREVAEVVVAWINDVARSSPEGADRAYWDADTIVLLDNQAIADDGYLPTRIDADSDGRYAIGTTFEWELVDQEL